MLRNLQSKLKPAKAEASRRIEAVGSGAHELKQEFEAKVDALRQASRERLLDAERQARRAADEALLNVAERGLDVRDATSKVLAATGRETLEAVRTRIGARPDLAGLEPRVAALQAGLDRLIARVEAPPFEGYDAMNAKELIAKVATLSALQRAAVHHYEAAHKARVTVLRACAPAAA